MRPGFRLTRRWLRVPASRFRAAGVAVALVAGLTVTAVSGAAASGAPGPRAGHAVLRDTPHAGMPGQAAATSVPARPPHAQNTTVTLLTGDQARLDATGSSGQQATPIPVGTAHDQIRTPSAFLRFTWGGDQYVVPDAAVPYLHSTLDPRLFDVSYLARADLGTSGTARLPVRITYTNPTAAASLPGVAITHRSGATATATVSAAQAARLGQLLADQWGAAYTHRSPAPVGRLPGIAKITLAPPRGAPRLPASPLQAAARSSAVAKSLPFYTLTLKAVDQNGKPGTFAGFVQNVGNASVFDQASCLVVTTTCGPEIGAATGTESLNVPKGTYSLAMSVVTPDSSGGFTTALVVKPQVTVDSNTSVTLDARTAVPYSAKLGMTVHAIWRIEALTFWRTSETGGGDGSVGANLPSAFNWSLVSMSPKAYPEIADQLLAVPTAPVTEGSLLFDASTQFSDGNTPGTPGPQYVLDFPYQGSIPSSLTYTVPSADLTTVHSEIYQSPIPACVQDEYSGRLYVDDLVSLREAPGVWAGNGQVAQVGPIFQAAAAPGPRTDYWYSGNPKLDLWQSALMGGSCGAVFGPVQAIQHGQQLTEAWHKAPTVPSSAAPPYEFIDGFTGEYSGDPRQTVCTACRQGDIGTVNILPFGDSDVTHYGDQPNLFLFGRITALRLKFYRNGALALKAPVAAGQAPSYPFGAELPLLPQAAKYQLDSAWTYSQDSAATVGTDWTFHSSPVDPAASLPSTESCAPDATRPCSLLPLLFLTYNLPLNDHNQATAGRPERISFTVTEQQNAPAPTGVSATVSASFDGGKTWTKPQAAASAGKGQFTTTISQPPLASTDGFAALRLTAKDGAGDSVTQTITCAYGLTS